MVLGSLEGGLLLWVKEKGEMEIVMRLLGGFVEEEFLGLIDGLKIYWILFWNGLCVVLIRFCWLVFRSSVYCYY